MHNKTSTLDLQSIAKQVSTWRANKQSSKESMPDQLKVLIAQLVPLYDIHDISTSLRIKRDTIKYFYKTFGTSISNEDSSKNNNSTQKNINFIPVQLSSLFAAHNNTSTHENDTINTRVCATVECQIIKEDGTKLIMLVHDTAAVIKAFICCN